MEVTTYREKRDQRGEASNARDPETQVKYIAGNFVLAIEDETEPAGAQFKSDESGSDGLDTTEIDVECRKRALEAHLASGIPDKFKTGARHMKLAEANAIYSEHNKRGRVRKVQRRAEEIAEAQRKTEGEKNKLTTATKKKANELASIEGIDADFEESRRQLMKEKAQKPKPAKRQAKVPEQDKDKPQAHLNIVAPGVRAVSLRVSQHRKHMVSSLNVAKIAQLFFSDI